MRLQNIVINNVRNLDNVHVKLSAGLNLFFGKNASGKTSFLESLHLLAYAKSFRSHHFKNIINYNADYLRITGQIYEEGQPTIPVGIEFREGRLRMRAAGQSLKKTSELAQYLPIIIIHQECQRILTDGPKLRRKFLDWGVFHVEQKFLKVWRRYSRALKQRNSELHNRKGLIAIKAWDRELNDTAVVIHEFRQHYCDAFIPVLKVCLEQLMTGVTDIQITYKPGWDIKQDYLSVLANHLEQDVRRGFTHYGPHRSDLLLRANGVLVHENLSRGQQKLMVCAMLIAQAIVYEQRSGHPCVLLVDDLKAELDREHVKHVMALLQGLNSQIIMTATEKEAVEPYGLNGYKTFHVERGRITEVV